MTEQLAQLAKPFPQSLIQKNPTGFGSYVKHSVVVEKLLAVVGPFDFRIVREIRDADTGQSAASSPSSPSRSRRQRPCRTPRL